MVSSYSETSSSVGGVSSEQLEEADSSSEAEILQGSSMPQQDSSSSALGQIAGFEEQFAKNQYDADFDTFYQNLITDAEQYQDKKGIKVKEGQPANFFCISCVPWLDYTAYCPVNYGGAPNLFPLLTFGKYTEADGAFTLPLTLTISHACMDGYHLSLFFNTLQYRLNCF